MIQPNKLAARLTIALAATNVSLASSAWSEEVSEEVAPTASTEQQEESPKPKALRAPRVRVSSRENREKLTFIASGDLEGYVMPVATIGAGASLGYFLSASDLLEARFVNSYSDEMYGLYYDLKMRMNSFSVKFTRFVGNSFNLGGFVQAKTFSGEYDHHRSGSYVRQTRYSTGVGFALGNRWQWSHFHLGADWLSIYVPIYVKRNDLHVWGEADSERAKTLFEDRTVKPDFSLRFMLGASI